MYLLMKDAFKLSNTNLKCQMLHQTYDFIKSPNPLWKVWHYFLTSYFSSLKYTQVIVDYFYTFFVPIRSLQILMMCLLTTIQAQGIRAINLIACGHWSDWFLVFYFLVIDKDFLLYLIHDLSKHFLWIVSFYVGIYSLNSCTNIQNFKS